MSQAPVLAVIGGSGLYHFPALKDIESAEINTPFGKPSAPVILGTLAGKRVAFLARHGIGHHTPPTQVNYRANIYALKALGVQRVVSVSACGSLRQDYAPGHIVIPDQLFDFTRDRPRTFFGNGLVVHIGAADPFCPALSKQLFQAVTEEGGATHAGGCLITIEGPRFSTRAESNAFRAWGMSIIGMTACPEAFLAREAELCYATMAHVTDYDVWHETEAPVTVEMVVHQLLENADVARNSVVNAVRLLKGAPPSPYAEALRDAIITHRAAIPPDVATRLGLLLEPFLG